MKSTATFLILSLALLTACGGPPKLENENSGAIVGLMTDAETGHPLAGVSVWVSGTVYGTRTDHTGLFRIEGLPLDSHRLVFTSVEYYKSEIDLVLSRSRQSQSLCIELKRNPNVPLDKIIEVGKE